jgi:hypothetical protein
MKTKQPSFASLPVPLGVQPSDPRQLGATLKLRVMEADYGALGKRDEGAAWQGFTPGGSG